MKSIRSIKNFYYRLSNAIKIGWWAFNNPSTLQVSNFEMLSGILKLIFEVATERSHRMSHVAYLHPQEGEKEIVSLWAGAGVGSSPNKRIQELIEENTKLKSQISQLIIESKRN
jgi:hypothetical protein